jgi:hypothetical protein
MLVDAITDGSSVDDDRDAEDDDDPVASLPSSAHRSVSEVEVNTDSINHSGPHSALHNGDVSPTNVVPAAGVTGVTKRKISTSFWRTNGRKVAIEDPPVEEEDSTGSLLRPLLAASGGQSAASDEPVTLEAAQLSTVVVAGKRSRRDTGSSVKSDQSGPTSSDQQEQPAVKRSRAEDKHKNPDNG